MPDATTILVVDDEPNIVEVVSAYLRKEGYTVYTAADGAAGLTSTVAHQPQLIVLDVMLPGIDGLAFLIELRRVSTAYVIILSAKSEEIDKIVGLSVGADDYMSKPFSPRELVARVKAALRRLKVSDRPAESDVLAFRHIRLDAGQHKVWNNGQPVELTEIEFQLLRALAHHRGQVLTRDQLLEQIWGHDFYGEERVIDVHIGHIRRKLGDAPSDPCHIVTVRGVGYRFEDELSD